MRFVLLALAFGCCAAGQSGAAEQVTVCQLAQSPEMWHRRVVEVTGLVRHAFEDSHLTDPSCPGVDAPWVEYGGRTGAGVVHCCGVPTPRRRTRDLVIEGLRIPLTADARWRAFVRDIRSRPDSIVRATLVGRFFKGPGYGHFGASALFAVQRVLSWPDASGGFDFRASLDEVPLEAGCSSTHVSAESPLSGQKRAEQAGEAWRFEDPARVAAEAAGGPVGELSGAPGRRVYRAGGDRLVTVQQAGWLRHYAADPARVAWVPVSVVRLTCSAPGALARTFSRIRTGFWLHKRSRRSLETSLTAELRRLGLFEQGLESVRVIGAASMTAVITGIRTECGVSDSVDIYRNGVPLLKHGGRRSVASVHFAGPARDGASMVLILETEVQCQSLWNGLSYTLYRMDARGGVTPLLEDTSPVWLGGEEEAFHVRLTPQSLLLEFHTNSVDAGLHNRVRVLRYNLGTGVRRTSPVALRAQDFVDEWLTQPWEEMAPWSSPATRPWHARARAAEGGEFAFVQRCTSDRTLTQVALRHTGGELFFLVQDPGGHRYRMMDVSDVRQGGCSGESQPSTASPSLFDRRTSRD